MAAVFAGLREQAALGEDHSMAADRPLNRDRGAPGPGEFEVVNALRDSLPTVRHASMLFDMVVHLLGDEAMVETVTGGEIRLLYRRTGPGSTVVIPWPLLTLSYVPVPVVDMDFGLPLAELPPPRAEVAPKLRGLKPGYVVVHDGAVSLNVTYREDGLWKETTRGGPPTALAGLLPALAVKNATPVERVADFLVRLDIGRNGTGRVHLPAPLPGGARGAFQRGLFALREALHRKRLPNEPGWIVADGYLGTVVAAGTSEDAALEAWRERVRKRPPKPPAAPKPPEPAPDDEPGAEVDPAIEEAMKKGAWTSDVPWPDPGAENVPAVVVRLDPCPFSPRPWGSWLRLLGTCGDSVFALERSAPDGFTLVGQEIVDFLDLDRLDERLDAIDAERPSLPVEAGEAWKGERTYGCHTSIYGFADPSRRLVERPAWINSAHGHEFDARGLLDGDAVRWSVLRHRWST